MGSQATMRSSELQVFDSTLTLSFFFFTVLPCRVVLCSLLFPKHCFVLFFFLLVHKNEKSQVLSFFNYINIKRNKKNFAWKKKMGINKTVLKKKMHKL